MIHEMQQWVSAVRRGDFAAAWALSYEELKRRDPSRRNDPSLPHHLRWVWDGRPLDGQDVLVRCYHGLGDTIQFARFIPMLADRAASVTVEAQPRLMPLLARIGGIDRLVPFDPAHPASEPGCDVEITELALALAAQPSQAPPPYLQARRAPIRRATIGICYAAGDWDPERSAPAELFAPICNRHRCLSLVAEPTELRVLNPRGCPFDVELTASFVAAVDLVITVDTMIAHLAGAMGKPTWLLLKAEPDWRWSPSDSGSIWYPSMRLYAQPVAGDWASVLSRVEADLEAATRRWRRQVRA
jgi:hypothetical protein